MSSGSYVRCSIIFCNFSLPFSLHSLTALPRDSFSGMRQLEYLNLEHTDLRNFALSPVASHQDGDEGSVQRPLPLLRELLLSGNPLHCDCHTRWLWQMAQERRATIELPPCSTPFILRNKQLKDLGGTVLAAGIKS